MARGRIARLMTTLAPLVLPLLGPPYYSDLGPPYYNDY
jgi:hypothetical protein